MSAFQVLFVYVYLIFTANGVLSFSSGAPTEACSTMKPGHIMPPQPGPAPFSIKPASAFDGDSLKIVLQAQPGVTFRGFLLMAFDNSAADDSHPLGAFTPDPEGLSQNLECGNPLGALTHTGSKMKSSLAVTWTPPLGYQGFIVFKASFVKTFGEYWVKVRSPVVEVKPTIEPSTGHPFYAFETSDPPIQLESFTTEAPTVKSLDSFTDEPDIDGHWN